MPIMTLNDRLVLITSNMESINRAIKRGDYSSVSTFLDSIGAIAKEGAELAKDMEDKGNGPKLEP